MNTQKAMLTIALMSFLCFNVAYSQVQYGVKTTYSNSNTYEVSKEYYSAAEHVFNSLGYAKNNSTFSYGVSAYSEMGYLFFMSDLMYRAQKTDFELETIRDGNYSQNQFTEEAVFLHIPITAGVLFKNFKIGAGPVINLPFSRNNAFAGVENIQTSSRKVETGFQFLLGVAFKNIHLDLKRELSFTSIADNYFVNGRAAGVNISPNKFSLSLGYYFK